MRCLCHATAPWRQEANPVAATPFGKAGERAAFMAAENDGGGPNRDGTILGGGRLSRPHAAARRRSSLRRNCCRPPIDR